MTTISEVQNLLRFLKDANVPVPLAMSKVNDLKKEKLTTPESFSKASLPTIQSIFGEEKMAKQVLSAAKRISKKRVSSSTSMDSPSPKKAKSLPSNPGQQLSPAEFEASLALPTLLDSRSDDIESEINKTILYTNRAPLVVTFVVQLLKHTMPSLPLSSRLSLAQAVMSMGAKAKALNLGIQSGKTAEDEGYAEGQPKLVVMGRTLRVMRRWGYEWRNNGQELQDQGVIKHEAGEQEVSPKAEDASVDPRIDIDMASQETIKGEPSSSFHSVSTNSPIKKDASPAKAEDTGPALWALDLEALRKTSDTSALLSSTASNYTNSLPIYDPHTARNYILKSFASATTTSPLSPSSAKLSKSAAQAKEREEKEHNLALLLKALDLVFASWIDAIGATELDRRAWGWYTRVRPSVEDGPKGWGGKGEVKLGDILALRR
ncbi:MAG: hypothetical protein Q9166_002486 [cf. Caloplaca sp. 2 TL-2023]